MHPRAARHRIHRRRPRLIRGVAVVAALGLLLAACGNGDTDDGGATADPETEDPATDEPDNGGEETEAAEDWPTEPIRFLVGASEGGGLDTLARILQGPLSEELGVDVIVENHPGAQTSIAATIAHNEGDDCGIIVHNNFPIFFGSYHVNDVDYTYEDIYPVAATQNQPSVIVVPGDSEFDDVNDLIEAIREAPGERTASVSAITSTNAIGLMEMEEVLGLDINIVDYDGGSPARQAVLSGEVDFSHTSVFAAMPLLEGGELKILAAHQTPEDWERFTEVDVLSDVPPLREATGEDAFGSNTATYGITVNRTCSDEHPERYQRLVDAAETVLNDPDYLAQLEELDLELSTLDFTPEEYHEQLEQQRDQVDQLAPELFGS